MTSAFITQVKPPARAKRPPPSSAVLTTSDHPGPNHPLRQSRCLTLPRLFCDAREAAVEPVYASIDVHGSATERSRKIPNDTNLDGKSGTDMTKSSRGGGDASTSFN